MDPCTNGVAPGMVPTEVMMTALDMDVAYSLEQVAEKRTPMKRLGTPDDIASAALNSWQATWQRATGETITVSVASGARTKR